MNISITKVPDRWHENTFTTRIGTETCQYWFSSLWAMNPSEAATELKSKYGVTLKTGDTITVTKELNARGNGKVRKYILAPSGDWEKWTPSRWKKYNALFEAICLTPVYRG